MLPRELAPLQAGPIWHSRWLTTSCVRTAATVGIVHHGLTGELLLRLDRLIVYVVSCYFHFWFHMKAGSSWLDALRPSLWPRDAFD